MGKTMDTERDLRMALGLMRQAAAYLSSQADPDSDEITQGGNQAAGHLDTAIACLEESDARLREQIREARLDLEKQIEWLKYECTRLQMEAARRTK